MGSGQACHEFEPSTPKDLPGRAAIHVKSIESSNVLPMQITVVELVCIEMLSIVEKALLVKLYYKNSEIAVAALRAYRYLKGMRDSKGLITYSALNKMKKFEATCSLASPQRSGRPSTATAVATTLEWTVQSMSAVVAFGEYSAR
ncbi:hypothetical protein TNCV_3807201 [Trichonephila clavipes]|nr:hypothetical protein TNCV_3807201 [Trichonephila clavipes]